MQLAAELVEWCVTLFKNWFRKRVMVVACGGYAKRPFLKRVKVTGAVVVRVTVLDDQIIRGVGILQIRADVQNAVLFCVLFFQVRQPTLSPGQSASVGDIATIFSLVGAEGFGVSWQHHIHCCRNQQVRGHQHGGVRVLTQLTRVRRSLVLLAEC